MHCSAGVPTRAEGFPAVSTRARIQFPITNGIEELRHQTREWGHPRYNAWFANRPYVHRYHATSVTAALRRHCLARPWRKVAG